MKTATGITRVHNGQLIDGTGAAPVHDAVVIVTDGYVTYAGRSADAPPTPDAQVVDARDGTIMPGLIEAHMVQGKAALAERLKEIDMSTNEAAAYDEYLAQYAKCNMQHATCNK